MMSVCLILLELHTAMKDVSWSISFSTLIQIWMNGFYEIISMREILFTKLF